MSAAPNDPSDQNGVVSLQLEGPGEIKSLIAQTIPTFPTDAPGVGRKQVADRAHYSDLSDLSDHAELVSAQKTTEKKTKTVSWLVEWLREERLAEGANCIDTYASINISKAPTVSGCVAPAVGKVGKVGIVLENSDLTPGFRSEELGVK